MFSSGFCHIARMPDETDAKKILSSPLENWRTTGMPLYYMDEDYPAKPEIQQPLPE